MKLVNKGKIIWGSQRLIKQGCIWGLSRSNPHLHTFWKCIYVLDPAALGSWNYHRQLHKLQLSPHSASQNTWSFHPPVLLFLESSRFWKSLCLCHKHCHAWWIEWCLHWTSLKDCFQESPTQRNPSAKLNTYGWPGRGPQSWKSSLCAATFKFRDETLSSWDSKASTWLVAWNRLYTILGSCVCYPLLRETFWPGQDGYCHYYH